MTRRMSLIAALMMTAMLAGLPQAHAQAMHEPKAQNFEFVVGSGAGATPDLFMRRIGKILNDEKIVTQPIVVQNRTGGSWTVASNYVVGKPGSEQIVFAIVPTVFTTPIVQGTPNNYDKLTPIVLLTKNDIIVVVRPDSPYNSLKDLVEAAKKKERSVQIAGANVGSSDHMMTSLIEKAGGVKLNYVPFDGGGGALVSAFLGGSVDAILLPLDEAYSLLKGGKIKPIAMLSEERRSEPNFKDIPTAREQGLDVIFTQHYGVAGPPDLDPAIAAWWEDKLSKMTKTAPWQEMLKENFLRNAYVERSKAKDGLEQQYQTYLGILRDVGLAKK